MRAEEDHVEERFAAEAELVHDLGLAADGKTKISTIVGDRLKNSLLLAFCAMSVGIPLALLLGVISGLWRDRLPDIIASTLAIFAMTIPEFVSATLLILVLSVWLAARHCPDLSSGTGKRILS